MPALELGQALGKPQQGSPGLQQRWHWVQDPKCALGTFVAVGRRGDAHTLIALGGSGHRVQQHLQAREANNKEKSS